MVQDKAAIQEKVTQVLQENTVMNVATQGDEGPWCNTLYFVEEGFDLLRIVKVTVSDRQDDDLYGGQPEWEGACEVLDQDGDEPLEAAEDRPVDDDGPMLGIVGARVCQVNRSGAT